MTPEMVNFIQTLPRLEVQKPPDAVSSEGVSYEFINFDRKNWDLDRILRKSGSDRSSLFLQARLFYCRHVGVSPDSGEARQFLLQARTRFYYRQDPTSQDLPLRLFAGFLCILL